MKKAFGYFIIAIVPIFLILTGVRLLLTEQFVNLEYHMPGFPDDPYGMTRAQRFEYAPLALDYLLNDEGIEFLGNQRFPDGTPLYNERELSHMEDVKSVAKSFLTVWLFTVALLVGTAAASWRFKFWNEVRGWLGRGGRATVFLLAFLLVVVVLAFDWFFTEFHHIFFEGDTWLFFYSDTLIRLFPIRFWQDVVIFIAGFALLAGAALWRFAPVRANKKPTHRRRK